MFDRMPRKANRFAAQGARLQRAFSVILLAILSCPFAMASSALLHAGRKSSLDPSFVTTFEGRTPLVASPVKPDPSLTVLWLLDTLIPAEQDEARASVLSLYSQLRGRHLRLEVLRGGTADLMGPFTSRAQLERALAAFETPAGNASGPALLDAMNANVSKLGSNWSSVLVIGRLPKLDLDAETYAQALLARSFATQQLRVFLLASDREDQRWIPLFESCSGAVVTDISTLNLLLDQTDETFLQVTWNAPEPPGGFAVFSAAIEDAQEQRLATVPDLVTSASALPTIESYAAVQQQLRQISAWLREPPETANLQRIIDVLQPARELNPIDPSVLRTEAILGERTHDYPNAVKAATLLTVVRPADGSSFVLLGRTLILAEDFDKAEAALSRAEELKVPPDDLAEPYARLHLGRKDERGALPYLEQALLADDKRQDLWLLQGQTADHLHNSHLAMKSFEQGLALGGVHVADSCTLLRLYVDGKETAKAHALAQRTVETLPADGAARLQFAECLDDAKLPAESLTAWKSVLAVQPDSERGHVRVARLLLESGDGKAAEEAAETSLQTLPKSGALFLAKADAILQEGRIYEARATLEEGAAGTQDPAVLARLAAAQEVYGDRAPEAYFHLASVLDKGSPQRIHALDRGFSLSLRDDDLKRAATFAELLDAEGHPEYRVLLGEKREVHNDAVVPGGLEALSVIAGVKQGTPPERFLAEFASQVVDNVCANYCSGDHYSALIQSYFATIADLERLGKRDGNRVAVVVSLNGKDERNHAQDVLKLLGLQMHTEKGQIRLDRGEKQSQNKKQDILAALEIDEVGLEEALQGGKSFTFEIRDEYAEVYPSAKMWKDSFPKLDQSQFALMLLRNPLMARLYVGIGRLDRRTLQALIGNSGLFVFVGHPTDLLFQFGASFALEGEHASVPGGTAAGPIWSQLAGASTDRPGAFYHALLEQKSPSLLAFFYALSNLDQRHQAFFTASLARTKRFYDLFATLPEAQAFSSNEERETAFKELLRSVPLDDDGHVAFPGSPEVWTVAKGNASDDRHVAKMMKKVSRSAAPEVEDEVLLHLLETRYKSHSVMSSELDNFLAIAGIDAHRAEPLDEESALMLAQHYGDFSAAYPYFAELSAIDAAGFRSFFSLVDGIAKQPLLERQLEMGELNSLIEWVVLIRRRHVIDDAEAAHLFAQICDRLAAANDEGTRSLASIDLAQAIIADCGHGAAGRWDDILRACLVGGLAGGSADRSAPREKDYGIILDEQKAPSIDAVRSIAAAAKAALTPAGAAHPAVIAPDKAALPAVPLPTGVKVGSKEKEVVLLYDPARAQKLIEEWNQLAARSQHDAKTAQSAQKLAGELLKEIEPQITLALAAPVYAYFFRSTDRVVSEDPLLLRKHRYINFVLDGDQHNLVSESAFMATSDGLGSYIEGGFAQIGLAAGFAAAAGWKQGGSGGSTAIAEEIAAIRSATWDQLLEADQRLVTLRILAARDWIVASAQDAKLFTALSEETSGLLSLSRRADLLNGIEERDWSKAWSSITLPDLFRLGGNYLRRFPSGPSASPVIAQLRAAAASNQGARLDILGGIPSHVLGCSHTHLVSDAPYEEYERLLIPTYLAERTAEFKLFLAYRADSVGVQPADLPNVAERLAAKAFSSSQMTDYHDWRSLLTAYASITNDNLKSALEQ